MTATIALSILLAQAPAAPEVDDLILAGNYPQAIQLLREAMAHPRSSPFQKAAYRLQLGGIYRAISRPDLAAIELRLALPDVELSKQAEMRGKILMALALALQESGEYAEAEKMLREALALGATSKAAAHQNLADLYRVQSKVPEAEAELKIAFEELRTNPDEATETRAQYTRAELLILQGKDGLAAKAFEALLAKPSGFIHGAALTGLGLIAYRQQAFRSAESYFRRSIEVYERDPRYRKSGRLAAVWVNLAEVLRITGRAEEALEYFDKATKLLEAQEDTLHFARILTLKGLTLATLKRLDAAEAALTRALELTTRHGGAEHSHNSVVLLNLGELALRRQQYAAAEAWLRRSVKLFARPGADSSPHAVAAYTAYAQALRKLKRRGEADEAESLAREVAARLPDRHTVSVFGLQQI